MVLLPDQLSATLPGTSLKPALLSDRDFLLLLPRSGDCLPQEEDPHQQLHPVTLPLLLPCLLFGALLGQVRKGAGPDSADMPGSISAGFGTPLLDSDIRDPGFWVQVGEADVQKQEDRAKNTEEEERQGDEEGHPEGGKGEKVKGKHQPSRQKEKGEKGEVS